MRGIRSVIAMLAVVAVLCGSAWASPPQYTIVDIGLLSGGGYSQGNAVSNNGTATGRMAGTGLTVAYSWTQGGGLVTLPNLTSPVRKYCLGNGVNDAGIVVGNGCSTSYGSSPLPLMWQNGVVSQLPLPSGQTLGRAEDINDNNVAVGSVGGGSTQYASIYSGGVGTVITKTTSTGCYMNVAYGINNSNLIVGTGLDPSNAARNVGFVYDMATNTATDLGGLPGRNGALLFDVSDSGYIVGGSMQNQMESVPFIWSAATGMKEIPLPTGASLGSARGVNDAGWVVGIGGGAYAVPFLYDGNNTYRVGDLLPAGSGWDLTTNTFSSAMGISNGGIIVGTGVYKDGLIHAYAMIPVPEPTTIVLLAFFAAPVLLRRRG